MSTIATQITRRTLSLTTAPATEPVSTAEALAYLRVDNTDETTYVATLVTAARGVVEKMTGRALISQTWKLNLDRWPSLDVHGAYSIPLERTPVTSVTSLKYYADGDAAQTTVSSTYYQAFTSSAPAVLILKDAFDFPSLDARPDAVEVIFVAGGANAAAVPEELKAAIKLLVNHLYENRQPLNIGNIVNELPYSLKHLLEQQKVGGFIA